MVTAIHAAVSKQGQTCEVVLARTDHARRFDAAGGWDGWAKEVATGIDYNTREAYYSSIVIPFSTCVGRATAAIVQWALVSGKRVYFTEDGSVFFEVKGLVLMEGGKNYKSYAQVTL